MTKLKNPLLSLGAVGRLAKDLVFTRRRKVDILEKKPVPYDAKSLAQLSWRHMYQKAVALWRALAAAEKQEWESLARPKHMTGFAYFISLALKPNPGLYLPLQGGTMAGEILMADHKIRGLPAPTTDQDAARKKYVDDQITAHLYTQGARVYHSVNQSIPNLTTVFLAFDGQNYDTDNIHDTVINNNRLTCKTPGYYYIFASPSWDTNGVGHRNTQLRLNGTLYLAHTHQITIAGFYWGILCFTEYYLALNDYVECGVYQSSGGALNVMALNNYSPIFGMRRVG